MSWICRMGSRLNLSKRLLMASYYENLTEFFWHKFIWYKGPAICFLVYTWMATMERLKTTDLLLKINIDINSSCFFCCNEMENHNHLFFECDFSFLVFSNLLPHMDKLFRPILLQLLEYFDLIQGFSDKEK